jgi:hypothetical protein
MSKLGGSSNGGAELAIPGAAFAFLLFLISVTALYVSSKKQAEALKASIEAGETPKKPKSLLFSFCSIVAFISALVFAVAINVATSDTSLNAYEPYRVLEIAKDSPVSEIQQAYRKLSRKHHPDKGGDPELFRQIARAYKALTDPLAMKNMRDFGNPEGDRSGSRFGIPSWLRGGEEGTNKVLLAVYLLVIVLAAAIPLYFFSRKSSSNAQEDEDNEPVEKLDIKAQQRLARIAQMEAAEEREKRKEEKRLLKKAGGGAKKE